MITTCNILANVYDHGSKDDVDIDLNIEDDIDIEDDVDIDQKPGFSRPSCVRAILMVPGPAPDRDPATTLHSAL